MTFFRPQDGNIHSTVNTTCASVPQMIITVIAVILRGIDKLKSLILKPVSKGKQLATPGAHNSWARTQDKLYRYGARPLCCSLMHVYFQCTAKSGDATYLAFPWIWCQWCSRCCYLSTLSVDNTSTSNSGMSKTCIPLWNLEEARLAAKCVVGVLKILVVVMWRTCAFSPLFLSELECAGLWMWQIDWRTVGMQAFNDNMHAWQSKKRMFLNIWCDAFHSRDWLVMDAWMLAHLALCQSPCLLRSYIKFWQCRRLLHKHRMKYWNMTWRW